MTLRLLTEHHLEFLSLKGGYKGSSESTLVKNIFTLKDLKLCILIHFFEIDRENDKCKEKNIKKKYWSRLDSNHSAPCFCIKRK